MNKNSAPWIMNKSVGRYLSGFFVAVAAVFAPCLSGRATQAPLTVMTNGSGTGAVYLRLGPGHFVPAQGALLTVGQNYNLVASPLNSYLTNWVVSGGTAVGPTSNPGLIFTMGNNTTITASFLTNIFLRMAGTYYGLYSNTDTTYPSDEASGMIYNLVVNTRGAYSFSVFGGGSSRSFSGYFTPGGCATNIYTNTLDNYVQVVFAITSTASPRTINGTVTGTNTIILAGGATTNGWSSSLIAIAAATNSSLTNTTNFSRAYTLVIPPNDTTATSGQSPPGYGYAWLTNTAGTNTISSVTIVGLLADWTSIAEIAPVNEAGTVPIYQNYFNTPDPGMLFGWLNLRDTSAAPAPSGTLTWIRKQSRALYGVYTSGFTNSVAVLGSTYVNTNSLTNYLSFTNTAAPGTQMVVSSDNFPISPLTNNLYVVRTNFLSRISTNQGSDILYRGYVLPRTGEFIIEFTNEYKLPSVAYGVLLQNSTFTTTVGANTLTNIGAGLFYTGSPRNPTNVGAVTLRAN